MARTKQPNEIVQSLAQKRWGHDWIAHLAAHVEVSERTVRRWGNGETVVPAAVLKLLKLEAKAA